MLPCLSKAFHMNSQIKTWGVVVRITSGNGIILGLNFAGWSCCLFTKNISVLELCSLFCSVWEPFKINTRLSPSLPLLMRSALIHTTLFLSVDFLVCHKAECLHPGSASWRHSLSAQHRVTVPEGMKSVWQCFSWCSVGLVLFCWFLCYSITIFKGRQGKNNGWKETSGKASFHCDKRVIYKDVRSLGF